MYNNETKIGLFFGIATFLMWGAFAIFFKLLEDVGPIEILAHRFLWSAFFVLLFLKIQGKIGNLKRYILNKKMFLMLTFCGCSISINWGMYIYAVTSDQILEASLGQFINPLMFVLIGAIFFKEKTSKVEKISILLVFCAILVQIINLGKLPIISLLLPISFSIYGLMKKKIAIPSLESLFCETIVLAIISLFYIIFLWMKGTGSFNVDKFGLLLILAGLVTVLPLITFNIASKSLNLSTIGYLQYITPTLTAILAVFVYKEQLELTKIISFILIWIGLILIGIDNYFKKGKNV